MRLTRFERLESDNEALRKQIGSDFETQSWRTWVFICNLHIFLLFGYICCENGIMQMFLLSMFLSVCRSRLPVFLTSYHLWHIFWWGPQGPQGFEQNWLDTKRLKVSISQFRRDPESSMACRVAVLGSFSGHQQKNGMNAPWLTKA